MLLLAWRGEGIRKNCCQKRSDIVLFLCFECARLLGIRFGLKIFLDPQSEYWEFGRVQLDLTLALLGVIAVPPWFSGQFSHPQERDSGPRRPSFQKRHNTSDCEEHDIAIAPRV